MEANKAQSKASNPYTSAWVSASAGSGKTKVLSDRVLNLMLMTGETDKILCLTFTKVAAAEMANRITDRLKKWSVMNEEELQKELELLTEEIPDTEMLERAKGLFAKALETPGGLKIMTIHSFCTTILERFPLEADVPPHFSVAEELTAQKLLSDSLDQVLESPNVIKEVQFLAQKMNKENLLEVLQNILKDRDRLEELLNRFPGIDALIFSLKQYFHIEKYHTENDIILENFTLENWPKLFDTYILKKDGKIKKKFLTEPIAQQVYDTKEKIKAFNLVETDSALFKIAFNILEKYNQTKIKNAVLDFDDLTNKTLELLKRSQMAAWVLFKLDGGIDHILVDEAQDTNPKQWKIIEALTGDFFAGEGKSEKLRTLFAVGDKKQSIYSFQGAHPDEFERCHDFFENKIKSSQNDFDTVQFNFSFRSTAPILDLVNKVLKNPKAAKGVIKDYVSSIHLSKRSDEAGLVEIWPLENPENTAELPDWNLPIKRQSSTSALTRCVEKVADKISNLISSKEILPSQNRPIQAGDFLILLQKRGKLMPELVRALKERNIPVAGVDRLNLTDHIAIKDLMALIRFTLLPEDDLNLACLLKSPLIGLSEEQLFSACQRIKNISVWENVKKVFPDVALKLNSWLNLADQKPPFEFLECILDEFSGRRLFITRLGNEVNEALDAFLDLALQYEQENTPSLQGFLAWLNRQEIIIKRDMDQSNLNAVRIMTVHGSKGLQGNIVFLPDTRSYSGNSKSQNLIWMDDLPFWISKKDAPDLFENYFEHEEELASEEKHRLLYVALTRASDRLYICGYNGKRSAPVDNWYDLIKDSLGEDDITKVISFTSKQTKDVKKKEKQKLPNDFNDIPEWALKVPPEIKEKPLPLSPSKMGEEEIQETRTHKDKELSLKRGSFIHEMLQYLPNIPKEKRKEVLERLKPEDIDLPENLLSIFEKQELKELFGADSMAEVPVIGKLNEQSISGQIDRLIIKEKEVIIVDFKTNRFVPQTVPVNYQKQLKAYKDLLKNIFPDRMVKAYLLWTENMTLVEV
ncbi:MAG: UvrD-helicase domain-containing protein [Alphaproteobacteria bacterium]|nr:UvrD-helicase domain-containing protein [Alphaproteobacteria bacterium]